MNRTTTDFEALIKVYKKHRLPWLLEIRKFYEDLPNLSSAIENAAQGIVPGNKMDNHQHRIGYKRCQQGMEALFKIADQIDGSKSFEELLKITDQVASSTYRLGPLWAYDTALRIGFYMEYEPQEVYVQSGVQDGVNRAFNDKRRQGRSLAKSSLSDGLKDTDLSPYQIENFLCIWGKPGRLEQYIGS